VDYRSNLGLLHLHDTPVTVQVAFYTQGGLDAVRSIQVPPETYAPITDIIRWVRDATGLQNTAGMIKLTADKPFFAIGGMVDTISNDPSVQAAAAGRFLHAYTPVVLSSGPWKTRTVISNCNNSAATVTLYLCSAADGTVVAAEQVIIPQFGFSKIDDIIAYMGQPADTYGRLEIDCDRPVSAMAHQYTDSHTGGIYPVKPMP